MKAFHNDIAIKNKYLARVKAHQKADQIIKGKYWAEGKGCAVGCTIHSSQHASYETELGIPEWLAHVEDTIFEGLLNERAMKWPKEFLSAIPVGVNLESVKTPFIIFVLESSIESMKRCKFDSEKYPDVKLALEGSERAVLEMIRCHREGSDLSAAESAAWSAAESAAESAESAAESAARSAARSAAESAARSAAESAAESARSAAESAAWSARSAAESAAESAAWSAAESAESAAWSAAWSAAEYKKFADKLLQLLGETNE